MNGEKIDGDAMLFVVKVIDWLPPSNAIERETIKIQKQDKKYQNFLFSK